MVNRPRRRTTVTELQVGTCSYLLTPCTEGLLLERRTPLPGGEMAQSTLIRDPASFDDLCNHVPARLQHPQQHARLKREGHEVLGSRR